MTREAPHMARLDILGRLIAFPTVSAASNLALIDFAEALLTRAGFQTQRIADPDQPKSGLVARIGGDGPGGVLLSAHSDVVPVKGQNWTRPPFELAQDGSRLYGRGSTDMKGFLASMLALAQRVCASTLRNPLMLVRFPPAVRKIIYTTNAPSRRCKQRLPGNDRKPEQGHLKNHQNPRQLSNEGSRDKADFSGHP
tara:strand:+ start:9162 stop:9749 length:588 start_codon:yes stop_codon:yes gene_type:complete